MPNIVSIDSLILNNQVISTTGNTLYINGGALGGGGSTVLNAITGFGTNTFIPLFLINNSGISNSNITSVGSFVGINAVVPTKELEVSGVLRLYNSQSIDYATFTGNQNGYQQLNLSNKSSSQLASTDLVATSDIGTETSYYVDLGINSSTYSGGFIGYSGDSYLYSQANDFYIGNPVTNKKIILFVGNAPTGINGALMIMEPSQVRVSGNIFASGGRVLTMQDATFSKSSCFFNSDGIPTGAYSLPIWRAQNNCMATGVWALFTSGNGIIVNARRNFTGNLVTNNFSVNSTGVWSGRGSLSNNVFSAGDTLEANIIAVSGLPTAVTIQVEFIKI